MYMYGVHVHVCMVVTMVETLTVSELNALGPILEHDAVVTDIK